WLIRLTAIVPPCLVAAIVSCSSKPSVTESPSGDPGKTQNTASPATSYGPPPISVNGPVFQDVTKSSGIDFTYKNGEEAGYYAILEALGGGAAVFDFDGDGLMDIFIPGGGHFQEGIEAYHAKNMKAFLDKKNSDPTAKPPAPKIFGYPRRLYRIQ